MNRNTKIKLFAAGTSVVALVGCSSQQNTPAAAPATPAADARPAKGRAQIWAENCARCHNMRPPDWYSGAQWTVAMQHMRVRGYLTGQEHRAIGELLESSH
jgi:hypothetical protein